MNNLLLTINMMLVTTHGWFDNMFYDMAKSALKNIFDTEGFETAVTNIALASSAYAELFEKARQICVNVVKPVGIALVTTFFIISLIEMASRDNTTLEHYIKEFIKLIIAVVIVENSWAIALHVASVGESIYNAVSGNTSAVIETIADNTFKDKGTFVTPAQNYVEQAKPANGGAIEATVPNSAPNSSSVAVTGTSEMATIANNAIETILISCDSYLGLVFASVLPMLITMIFKVASYIAIFMRAFDVAWRLAFLPVGVSNMFEGGVNSPGLKYIKSLFGAVLAGAVMVVILKLTPTLMIAAYKMVDPPDREGNAVAAMLAMSGAQLAAIGAVFGASSKVKEIFS